MEAQKTKAIETSNNGVSAKKPLRKRKGKITVAPHLDTSYTRAEDGKSRFSLRVLIRGKKKYYPIGNSREKMLYMLPRYWGDVVDEDTGKSLRQKRIVHTRRNSNSQTLERRLFEEVHKMESLIQGILDQGTDLTHENLKVRWERWSIESIGEYALAWAASLEKKKIRKEAFIRMANDICEFEQSKDSPTSICEVSVEWLCDFQEWLSNEKPVRRGPNRVVVKYGISDSSLRRQMVDTGRIITTAFEDGFLAGKNPYAEFAGKKIKGKSGYTRVRHLDEDDVMALLELYESGELLRAKRPRETQSSKRISSIWQEVLQQFLACVLTGFRVSDLRAWVEQSERCEISKDSIRIKMAKTGKWVRVPISERLRKLVDFTGDKPMFLGRVRGTRTLNRVLREILAYAGIDKYITWHGSRHTFATLLLSQDVNMKVVSGLLGHSSISTTEIYAKVIDKTKDEAIAALDRMGEKQVNQETKDLLQKVAMMIGMNASKGLVIPKEISRLLDQLAEAPENEQRVGIVVDMTA